MVNGLYYLNTEKNQIHRDFKLDNMMIMTDNSTGKYRELIKIIDFGQTKKIKTIDQDKNQDQ